MKLSTEAIVAAAIAVIFAILSLGAIASERGEQGSSGSNVYVATSNSSLSHIPANGRDALGFY
jgi:hypothetical protein